MHILAAKLKLFSKISGIYVELSDFEKKPLAWRNPRQTAKPFDSQLRSVFHSFASAANCNIRTDVL